jgi:hypothetical protein
MAAINGPVSTGSIEHSADKVGILAEIADFWRQFVVAAFNPYRPEQHYMRGPGPAWRAKHGLTRTAS